MTDDTTGRLSGREWAVLLVLCGAIFLEGSDVAMFNVALPAIRADLGLSTTTLSGVITAYVVGYGGFMLLGGRAADVFGRRRMFLLWLAVFAAFSGLGGLATEGWMVLVARFVTGISAGFLTPAGISLITTSFPQGPRRNRALIVYGAAGAGGFSLGLVVGGLLTAVGWRWVFFAPVLVAVAILVIGAMIVPRAAPLHGARHLDLLGASTVTAAMVLLAYGLVRLEHPGVGTPLTVALLLAGALLLTAFVRVQRRAPSPLLRLGLLRTPGLVRANVTALLFAAAFYGYQFMITLYLQEIRGWTSLQTGLALLLMAIDVVIAPTLTPRLVQRFGLPRVIGAGMVSAAVAYLLMMRAEVDWAYAAMVPTFLLVGLAFALAYGPLNIAGTNGVRGAEQGVAGALVNTAFQFGAAFGVSAAAAAQGLAATGSALGDFRVALLVPTGLALTGAAVIWSGTRRRAGEPEPEAVELAA